MPAGIDDPGPLPADELAQIVKKLRLTLKDPYSLRDLTLCPAKKTDPYYSVARGFWLPATWLVKISLNSKNSYGGYTGPTLFFVTLDKGHVTEVSAAIGFMPDIDAKDLEAAQACPRIPDAEVQRLLAN